MILKHEMEMKHLDTVKWWNICLVKFINNMYTLMFAWIKYNSNTNGVIDKPRTHIKLLKLKVIT